MSIKHIFIDISGGYMVGRVLDWNYEDIPGIALIKCGSHLTVNKERLTLHTALAERVLCAHLTDMTRFY